VNKYEYYEEIKKTLQEHFIWVSPYKEINFGIQFSIKIEEKDYSLRIYESKKKGVNLDYSLIKSETIKAQIQIYLGITQEKIIKSKPSDLKFTTDQLENAMIGVDESGKGDYFGPLVIAGVYADMTQKVQLMGIGVCDSKTLKDEQIKKLAEKIKELCVYEVVVIGNEAYNRMYNKINNLNKLLAWGHARVIENLLEKVPCQYVLSDQFGREDFILKALMEKGKKVTLEQRPKAEQNVVVAAASILARARFVEQIEILEKKYGQAFPKGAGTGVSTSAKKYVACYGRERLGEVAKLHFKTTQNI
jgi:ribonuclease HIII